MMSGHLLFFGVIKDSKVVKDIKVVKVSKVLDDTPTPAPLPSREGKGGYWGAYYFLTCFLPSVMTTPL